MKIRIIPENDAERAEFTEKFGADAIEHSGIKEYFVLGNKTDNGCSIDFHEWSGTYRYLMSSLNYYYELINDERKASLIPSVPNVSKFRPISQQGIDFLKEQERRQEEGRLMKQGETAKIEPIDVSPFRQPKVVQVDKEDDGGFVDEDKKVETEVVKEMQPLPIPRPSRLHVIPASQIDQQK